MLTLNFFLKIRVFYPEKFKFGKIETYIYLHKIIFRLFQNLKSTFNSKKISKSL